MKRILWILIALLAVTGAWARSKRVDDKDRTSATDKEKAAAYGGYCDYQNVYDIFRGRFAGVTVRGSDIVIRGVGSVNAEIGALVILDGVPVSGDLSFLSPCDIARISIVKDGSAAFYGARGANGVVLIERRKNE